MEKGKITWVEKWLNNKNIVKIVSLLLAIILWFYVAVTQDPTRTDRVSNVEIICGLNQNQINQGLSIISKSHDSVSFEATGKRSLVTGVRGTYYAKLDLEDISAPGKYSITPDISRPDGVYINSLSPSVVEVYVDKFVLSPLPVTVKTVGTLSENLVITDMTTDISQMNIQLPSLDLEQIAYVGAVIDLTTVSSSSTVNCQPVLLDSENQEIALKNVVFEKPTIAVDITVEQVKTVPVTPVVTGMDALADGFTVTASPKTVVLYGDKDTLDAITEVKTRPLVLHGKVSDGQQFTTSLLLPSGTRLKPGSENTVDIVFTK